MAFTQLTRAVISPLAAPSACCSPLSPRSAALAPAPRLWFFSTQGARRPTPVPWAYGDCLVFGRETVGLPADLLEANRAHLVRIPMLGDHHRSLNQAQAAAIGLYEALRQTENW